MKPALFRSCASFPILLLDYRDMIEAQYRLLTEGLKVNHLRLVVGTSMGEMHTWLWGEAVIEFYRRLGYSVDEVVSMGKRLEHDEAPDTSLLA